MVRKLIIFSCVALLTVAATCGTVSAQEYSTEYPDIYNSGSPLWLHCEIQGMGEYLIVIDPNTNPQSFGFDSPTGYNLINNTGGTIYGRAYNLNSNEGFSACWYSYYCLSLKTGTNAYGQVTSYEPYTITAIYGTTLDLIDHVGDRGNDTLTREERMLSYAYLETFVLVVIGLCLFIRGIFKFTYRKRCIHRG